MRQFQSALSGSVTMKNHPAQGRRHAVLFSAALSAGLLMSGASAGAPLGAQAAGQRTAFVTFPIPVHVEGPTRGLFVQVVREASDLAKLSTIHIEVMPPPRALRSFGAGESDALFPALDVSFEDGSPIVRTAEALDCKEDFVFTRKGAPAYATLDELRGRRVGITRGYPYAREVTNNKNFVIEEALSDEANIHKLLAGRIDAFVLDEKTGIKAFESLELKAQMQYDPSSPVSRQEVYVAFRNTPSGRVLARQFSDGMRKLKLSGRYQAITKGITFAAGCSGR
jgi:polar amino acid transport system substrate-binding protein